MRHDCGSGSSACRRLDPARRSGAVERNESISQRAARIIPRGPVPAARLAAAPDVPRIESDNEEGPMRRVCGRGLRNGSLIAGLAVLAFALAGVPETASAQADWEKVIAEAKKEGKVVIYNGTNFKIVRKLADLFRKRYGIAAEVLDGGATEIRERVRTDQAARPRRCRPPRATSSLMATCHSSRRSPSRSRPTASSCR
jgi:hypothetical protein